MPTPTDRLLDSNYQTQKIIRDHLVDVYREQYKRFYRELHRRLLHTVLLPDGTYTGPESARTSILDVSMRRLQRELFKLSPTVAAQTRPLDALVDENTRAWLDKVAKKAPPWVAASSATLATEFKATLEVGTLVEKKILEGSYQSLARRGKVQSVKRSLQALRKGNDIEARVFRNLAYNPHGAHAALLDRTRRFLHEGLQSGRNFNELAMILEREIWGVDFAATGTHKGVLSAAKRLIVTEYQHAHNLERYNVGKNDPRVKKYEIQMDSGACPECVAAYAKRFFTYGGDEPPLPPKHPRCHCSLVDFGWEKPAIRDVA